MDSGGEGKMLFEEKYDNGISIAVADRSRRIAGDRWLVKIECTLAIAADKARQIQADDGTVEEDSDRMSGAGRKILLKRIARERNFVDQQERQRARDELFEQLQTTIFPYCRKASFARRLLAESLSRTGEGPAGQSVGNPYAHLDDEEGPADFSSLFG